MYKFNGDGTRGTGGKGKVMIDLYKIAFVTPLSDEGLKSMSD